MTLRNLATAAALLCGGISLFACSSDEPTDYQAHNSQVTSPKSEVQLYHLDGSLYRGSDSIILPLKSYVCEGSIIGLRAKNGKFVLDLPALATECLTEESFAPGGIAVTPSTARGATLDSVVILLDDGKSPALIAPAYQVSDGSWEVTYIYLDSPAKLKGSTVLVLEVAGVDYEINATYDANLQAGWNPLYEHLTSNEGRLDGFATDDASQVPGELKWTIVPLPSSSSADNAPAPYVPAPPSEGPPPDIDPSAFHTECVDTADPFLCYNFTIRDLLDANQNSCADLGSGMAEGTCEAPASALYCHGMIEPENGTLSVCVYSRAQDCANVRDLLAVDADTPFEPVSQAVCDASDVIMDFDAAMGNIS